MFIAKTLGLFFLLPFTFAYRLIKDIVMRLVVSLYRGWRTGKKYIQAKNQARLGHEQQSISVPAYIMALSLLVLGFNINGHQQSREFGSQSLLNKIFNEVEEFTVIESVLAQNDPETSAQMLAALETNVTLETENSTTTPISDDDLKPVADANGALVRPNVTSSAVAQREQVIEYTVQPGDTLSNIAEAHGITTATVLWANHLSDHSIIRPGETLKILPRSGVLHIVQSGDTLSSIANKYEVEIEEIVEANELVSEHQLQIKQGLMIPNGKPPATEARSTQLASFGQIFSSSPAVPSESGYIWPTSSRRITQYYWVGHKAIDVGGSINITLVATKAGRVEYSGWSNGYGYNVLINHGNGVKSRYAHMRQLWVETGDQVEQGEGLGKQGSTGRSTGPHLHFELIINGVKVNPLSYLP